MSAENVMKGCVRVDKEIVLKWFQRYPDLEKFIDAGTISLKRARSILKVDRWFMDDMFNELLMAGAVVSSGNNSWRATEELHQFLEERRRK